MNITETSALLAKVQAFDNRNVDEAVLVAWAEILEPYMFQDCLAAVTDYYRRSTKWMMPAHVVEFVREVEAARFRAVKHDIHLSYRDEVAALEAGDYQVQHWKLHRLIATGQLGAAEFVAYVDGNLELASFTSKAVTA